MNPLTESKRLPDMDILCIDIKSFYASVEAVDRNLDPLTARIAVLSHQSGQTTGGSLVLAASPVVKKEYGVKLGTRMFQIKPTMNIIMAEPRMDLYVKMNDRINKIFRQFTDDQHWMAYSIDESFVDITESHSIFHGASNMEIAEMIQDKVKKETGLICTIGIGTNMLMAKLAMDNEAKRQPPWRAEWDYSDVETKLQSINPMTEFWGIGNAYNIRLERMGIKSIRQLAHTDIYKLLKNFGIMGEQLYYNAWGIDYSDLERRYVPRKISKGFGNSQILMHDYLIPQQIEVVIREIADQVASRLRKASYAAEIISLSIGYSSSEDAGTGGFSTQIHMNPTNSTRGIQDAAILLFYRKWDRNSAVRQIGIRMAKVSTMSALQLNLFENPNYTINRLKLDQVIDEIRSRFGHKAAMYASSKIKGATALQRSGLIGGHASSGE